MENNAMYRLADMGNMLYLFFAVLTISAILYNLLFKKQGMGFRSAFFELLFWVLLALGFVLFLYESKGATVATKFISGYFLEFSLSIDNVFVFLLIFKSWGVGKKSENRALLIGILIAIFLRLIFIYISVRVTEQFAWILYLFGAFLIYTGIKVMRSDQSAEKKEQQAEKNIGWYLLKYLRIRETSNDTFWVRIEGKIFFTHLGVAVFLLALTDIVFAIDSIPSIVAIVREDVQIPFSDDDILVMYASNIFAVLSLRPLYFMLKKGYDYFPLLSYAIGFILIFIGVSLLLNWIGIHIPHLLSLGVIIGALLLSMILSSCIKKKIP